MRKYKWVAMALLVSVLILSGCSSKTEGDGEANGPAKPILPIKIGVMSDVGAVPFIIAKEQGFFEKRGLDVEIQVFKSAIDRDTALQTGNLDGAMSDMLSIIFFKEAGFDVKMISDTYGNYKMVSSPKIPAEVLVNKDLIAIGLSSNTVIDFATQKISEAKGFDAKLSKVAIPQMPVRLEMLGAGEIDGATLPDPLASAAILNGGTLVGSTEEFNLFPAIFIMTETSITDNSDGIKLMYEAYDEAVNYLNSKKTDEYFDFLVESLGFPPVLKGQFEMPELSLIKAPDQNTFDQTSAWMFETGLSKQTYDYKTLTDSSMLPQ